MPTMTLPRDRREKPMRRLPALGRHAKRLHSESGNLGRFMPIHCDLPVTTSLSALNGARWKSMENTWGEVPTVDYGYSDPFQLWDADSATWLLEQARSYFDSTAGTCLNPARAIGPLLRMCTVV